MIRYWLIDGRIYAGTVDERGYIWPSGTAHKILSAEHRGQARETLEVDAWDALAWQEAA